MAPDGMQPTATGDPAPFGLDVAFGDVPGELPDTVAPLANSLRSLEPVLLTHVVSLQTSEGSSVEVQPLSGALAVALLSVHAERMGVAPLVLGRERYMSLLRDIAEWTSVAAIHRHRIRGPSTRPAVPASTAIGGEAHGQARWLRAVLPPPTPLRS